MSAEFMRGVLLEELALYLLELSGYRTVTTADGCTTDASRIGLLVRGRGAKHQIDAIADYAFPRAFSHPQRLLVEAKFLSRKVDLGIVRETVGAHLDINQYYTTAQLFPSYRRFHYQCVIFSATEFTKDAQSYAFAHDVYLFPLGGSSHLRPTLEAIVNQTNLAFPERGRRTSAVRSKSIRTEFRERLRNRSDGPSTFPWLTPIVNEGVKIGGALVGVLSNSFPIFLVPQSTETVRELLSEEPVQIYWEETNAERGWTVKKGGRDIFTFDLPVDLFNMYRRSRASNPDWALDLKQDILSQILAVHAPPHSVVPQHITLFLDSEWMARVRATRSRLRDDRLRPDP